MGKRRPLRISGSDSNSSSKVHRNEETENASSRYQLNDNNMSNSDPDPEEDDEEDEEDNLFQQQTNELINMTFEFKDMKEMYCYDIAKMLEYLLPNHEARSIGEVVANQGQNRSILLLNGI